MKQVLKSLIRSYIFIAAQLADEVIAVEELNDFPEDIRQKIFLLSGI